MKPTEQAPCNYRISLKAVIRDVDGSILLNRENGHEGFSLPGGGIEHGESISEGLTRELFEELGLTTAFEYKPICMLPLYVDYSNRWLMWSVYSVTIPPDTKISLGSDSHEIRWSQPADIESETRAGKLIQEVIKFL